MSDQLKMHSPNLVDSNIEKIAALFPNCVTEAQGENGELKKAIDFDLLKQELSQVLVEGEQERYRLDWVGKKESILTANAPIAKTLRPCREESVNFDTTENLFIEGDNLEALKLLQENYLGKVKMIYIDPPYNTGNDFIYEDDFAESTDEFFERSNQVDEDGNKLVAWKESEGRFHSAWLSMIYVRLKLARNLLADTGVVFISIDENEIANLRRLCDEIFGESNHLGTILWKKKTNGNNIGYIPPVHDYILCYGKVASDGSLLGFPITEEFIAATYSNPDNDPHGPWTTTDLSANHKGPLFEIENKKTGKKYLPAKGRYWVFNELEVLKRIQDGRIIFGKTGNSGPVQKKYLIDKEGARFKPESWWDNHGFNSDGTSELANLFEPKVFDHPKPTKLLMNILQISTEDNDIVMDFFAGSSSTAHAVLAQNALDGGNRKFILVQYPEPLSVESIARRNQGFLNISEFSKERIRRAGKKIVEENAAKVGIENLDIGFRVLRIDSTNMKDVYYTPDAYKQVDILDLADHIKEDRTSEDLLFQVMLDWGLELSLPIERKTIQGKEVFYVAGNSLVACFEEINFAMVDEIAQDKPLRVVSAERAIQLDHDKTNIKERFKQLSPETEVKFI